MVFLKSASIMAGNILKKKKGAIGKALAVFRNKSFYAIGLILKLIRGLIWKLRLSDKYQEKISGVEH